MKKILCRMLPRFGGVCWCLVFFGLFGMLALTVCDKFHINVSVLGRVLLLLPIMLGILGLFLFAVGLAFWAARKLGDD